MRSIQAVIWTLRGQAEGNDTVQLTAEEGLAVAEVLEKVIEVTDKKSPEIRKKRIKPFLNPNTIEWASEDENTCEECGKEFSTHLAWGKPINNLCGECFIELFECPGSGE